ncbi:kinase-like domain-containing protein [Ephemerocybe angulata]|uniref:Kinase-like domain-containing protein n=1 Tax=Ephemerocybe angulata TaxID=980116 RepID=A0A8H6HQP3_9AGAR|nr:kinase-like domain-containing protein [Tulosesus angulatus]
MEDGDSSDPAVLSPEELYWKDQYEWLLAAGYRLRSRYSPDWKPSWSGTSNSPMRYEDSRKNWASTINYAIQLKTNRFITIKKVDKVKYPREVEVTEYLSSEPLRDDPSNHAVRPIEVLSHPTDEKTAFLVLPLLRNYDDPEFKTVGEIVGFIGQFLVGMKFLHEHKVSHGDVSINNIMMDASDLYPKGFHPIEHDMAPDYRGPVSAKYTRTEKPPQYYLIDFGLSRRLDTNDDEPYRPGTDVSLPEYEDLTKPIDAYLVDVYCVGNMIKYEFLDGDPERGTRTGFKNFEFLRPLVDDMTHDDPDSRPKMVEVVKRFQEIVKSLSTATLRARCLRNPLYEGEEDPPGIITFALSVGHWYKRILYVAKRLPPVPGGM